MYNIDTCRAIWCQPHPDACVEQVINQMFEIAHYQRCKVLAIYKNSLLELTSPNTIERRWFVVGGTK